MSPKKEKKYFSLRLAYLWVWGKKLRNIYWFRIYSFFKLGRQKSKFFADQKLKKKNIFFDLFLKLYFDGSILAKELVDNFS